MDPVPVEEYIRWMTCSEYVASNDAHFMDGAWKTNESVNYMLEHVLYAQGIGFLVRIQSEFKLDNELIVSLCRKNDSRGQPALHDVGLGTTVSPSSLRYIFHACTILSSIKKSRDEIDIVEVGCGYGGLALIMNELSEHFGVKINNYALYDLPGPQKLQRKYLEHHGVKFNIVTPDCLTFGAGLEGSSWFLVSAYGLGEFEVPITTSYLANLLHKTVGGFVIWNTHTINPLLATDRFHVETEVPQTSVNNQVITW
jgi:hypothetical protein